VPINFVTMMIEILNLVIVPVVSGLVANRVLYSARPWCNRARWLGGIALAGALLAAGFVLAPVGGFETISTLRKGAVVGSSLIALVALAKLVVSVLMRRPNTWMDRTLPLVSMVGICVILGIITARASDKLLKVGSLLIFAAMLHNAVGYCFGYWLARAVRLDKTTCRTIAIETGMQNAGMASSLAMTVLKSADAALAPVIFGSWMNVSGSIMASWWRKRPIAPGAPLAPARPLQATAPVKSEPALNE
jgi:BASS family bile acid:Na+ symporter